MTADRCPVCTGRGWVEASFYSGLPILGQEACRTCRGTGVLHFEASERPLPQMALRRHDDGTMDDVAVKDVEMFRAEQLDSGLLWLCCYLRNGERVTFNVHARCRPKRLEYDVGEMPRDWVDIDERDGHA